MFYKMYANAVVKIFVQLSITPCICTIFSSNLHNNLFKTCEENLVGISNGLASLLHSRSSAEIITSRTLLIGDNNFTDAGQLVRCHDNEVTL
jgi:hypothetical protein